MARFQAVLERATLAGRRSGRDEAASGAVASMSGVGCRWLASCVSRWWQVRLQGISVDVELHGTGSVTAPNPKSCPERTFFSMVSIICLTRSSQRALILVGQEVGF